MLQHRVCTVMLCVAVLLCTVLGLGIDIPDFVATPISGYMATQWEGEGSPGEAAVQTSPSVCDFCCYEGMAVSGSPEMTLSRGSTVYTRKDGVVGKPGHGKFQKRAPYCPHVYDRAEAMETREKANMKAAM
ncbi:hypothetical protein KIPB_004152 [Kipferlia bialata]|uniref:Secreted protein n=1 Tax=Kipferlia bialata TaxID=797122 RepID=A0A9K3CWJ9_9EUKA|nr:hypothetical protein KIPB_004152 [Kipferlia bialata]|eukprot:g4152.t1